MRMVFDLENASSLFGTECSVRNLKVVTAESCTAGLIGATIAMTAGSSAWFERGYIVYTPEAKNQMLGVSYSTIAEYDITSVQVAREMALGALDRSNADLALAVTGLAGPSGGTEEIPVGTVCMAWGFRGAVFNQVALQSKVFAGSRNEIRIAVVEHMLMNCPFPMQK